MGKTPRKLAPELPEPVDTQALAEDLYERGLITRQVAYMDQWSFPKIRTKEITA